MAALDLLFPDADMRMTHEARVPCAPEQALALLLAAPAAPSRAVAALLRLRGLHADASVRVLFDRLGLEPVVEAPLEVVLAAAGRPWTPAGRIVPLAAAGPGDVRIAFAARAEAVPGGSLLVSETRVQAVDDGARRRFRRYWLVVGPFAGWIRGQWLRAAVRAAHAGAGRPTPQ